MPHGTVPEQMTAADQAQQSVVDSADTAATNQGLFATAHGCVQAMHCRELFAAEAPQLLHSIHPLLSDTAPAVVDNACGAAARILQAHADRLPVAQVLRVLLQHLPIRKDWEEVQPVAEALTQLVSGQHAQSVGDLCTAVYEALVACAFETRASAQARQTAARGCKHLLDRDARVAELHRNLSADRQGCLKELADSAAGARELA